MKKSNRKSVSPPSPNFSDPPSGGGNQNLLPPFKKRGEGPNYVLCSCLQQMAWKLNSFRSSHRKMFYKVYELPSSKSCKVSGFQTLITTAMRTILDAAGFLDPPLAFICRENDGYFNFNAISVCKVSIDFWIKIVARLFVNDQQILTELFKSFSNL